MGHQYGIIPSQPVKGMPECVKSWRWEAAAREIIAHHDCRKTAKHWPDQFGASCIMHDTALASGIMHDIARVRVEDSSIEERFCILGMGSRTMGRTKTPVGGECRLTTGG